MENENHIKLANILSHHKYILDSLYRKSDGYERNEIFDDLYIKLVNFAISMKNNNNFDYDKFHIQLVKSIKNQNQNIDDDYHTQ